jgi:hypothetical protein
MGGAHPTLASPIHNPSRTDRATTVAHSRRASARQLGYDVVEATGGKPEQRDGHLRGRARVTDMTARRTH